MQPMPKFNAARRFYHQSMHLQPACWRERLVKFDTLISHLPWRRHERNSRAHTRWTRCRDALHHTRKSALHITSMYLMSRNVHMVILIEHDDPLDTAPSNPAEAAPHLSAWKKQEGLVMISYEHIKDWQGTIMPSRDLGATVVLHAHVRRVCCAILIVGNHVSDSVQSTSLVSLSNHGRKPATTLAVSDSS